MKKLVKYVSSIMICLFASLLLVACGEPTIVSAHIKDGTIVTTVDRGSAKTDLKLNNAKAVIKFSDGSQIEVDASKLSFGDIDLSTIGNDKQLKVKYGDFEFAVEIDVVKPHVTSAYIEAGTVNTSVVVGSALNLTNAVAVVNYSNGEQKVVAAADLGFNMATLDLTTPGEDKPLKITYDGFTFEIKINVVEDPEDAVVEVASAVITKGSIVDTVIEGATIADLGLDNATALITYDDRTSKTVELNASNFNTANLDLTTVGTKTIAVTYEYNNNLRDTEFVFYVQIVVNPIPEEQKITLTGFSSDLEDEFNANRAVKIKKDTEFMDRTKSHKVGDDNPLEFRANAMGVDPSTETPIEHIRGVKTEVKVQKVVSGVATDLTAQELAQYVEATTYTSVDFSQDAVGKTFKVTVSATNFNPDYFDGTPSFDLTFDVVDGYNVYEAKELSLFDNANIDSQWDTLKTAWGLKDVTTKALVLQNSIHVTDDVIPASHFYSQEEYNAMTNEEKNRTNQEIVGSLKDHSGDSSMLYMRTLTDTEDFAIYGNYFDISVADKLDDKGEVTEKGLSRSVISDHDSNGIVVSTNGNSYITTHTALFKVQGVMVEGDERVDGADANEHASSQGKLTVEDTYFLGNAPRDVNPLCSGGIILFKSESVNLDVKNTINKDWFIGWMTEYGYDQRGISSLTPGSEAWFNMVNYGNPDKNSHTNISYSKGYNNYSSLLYIWGTPNVVIDHCEFVGAGGPVIVTDHVTGDFEDFYDDAAMTNPAVLGLGKGKNSYHFLLASGGFAPEINIVESRMESFVNGTEAWFATYDGATAAFSQVTAANLAYTTSTQSTFLVNHEGTPNAMNMIVIHKWGAKEFPDNPVFSRGLVNMFDTTAQYEAYYDADDTNNPTYFGYDRSIAPAEGDFNFATVNYSGNGALKHKANIQSTLEMGRFENSFTGSTFAFNEDNQSYDSQYFCVRNPEQGAHTYLNGYLSNGFGVMMELFPYSA